MVKPKEKTSFPEKYKYILLLIPGFLGISVIGCSGLKWGSGIAALVWILSFLALTVDFRSKRRLLISGAVFCIGYLIRFTSAVDMAWLFFLLFTPMGLLLYGVFLLYGWLLNRWNRFRTTLCFPIIWTAVYLLATLVRFPALIRIDVLFMDMPVLIQAESVLGSVGLSFLILWVMAMVHYAIRSRKPGSGALAAGIYFVIMIVGIVYLQSNNSYEDTVRVAYTTGPDIGDYINYTALPVQTYLANMEYAAAEAAAQGAGILIFSEEAFDIAFADESDFLDRCCEAAKTYHIHMLVGLDVSGRTASEKAQNKIVWIDSEGKILGSYRKSRLIPVLESGYLPGDGQIPSHTITVNGKTITVSYAICYDSNFPAYMDSMDGNTDILFLPSWDWKAVTELHSRLCCALAVENRVSILKCTYDGSSIAVTPDGAIVHSTDTEEVGFGQILVADVPLPDKQGHVAETHEKDGYVKCIIAVEILSLLICAVLLYGSLFETREKSARNRLFSVMVFTCIVALAADALSWILDGSPRLVTVLYACTIVSVELTFVLTGEFIAYLTAYIRERKEIAAVFQRVYMAAAVVFLVVILIFCINGKLFYFENGVYVDGPWYGVYVIINIITVFLSLLVFLRYQMMLSRHDVIATSLYIAIPSLAAVANVFIPTFTYAYPSVTLSLLVIYVMLQSERAEQLRRDEQLSSHMATHDVLTGLLNRRAYDDALCTLSESNRMAGVIFADLNGLKYANDHFGHEEGDRLIVSFSQQLSDHFRKEDIFRISGDEFAVIITDMTKPNFESLAAQFEASLEHDGAKAACMGTEYGSCRDVLDLMREAEAHMYVKKDAYHAAHPELNRG